MANRESEETFEPIPPPRHVELYREMISRCAADDFARARRAAEARRRQRKRGKAPRLR